MHYFASLKHKVVFPKRTAFNVKSHKRCNKRIQHMMEERMPIKLFRMQRARSHQALISELYRTQLEM